MMANKFKDFITKAEWNSFEAFDGTEGILNWKDIPQDIIYYLMIEQKKDSKYQSYVLHFSDNDGITYSAYAPSHFIKEIRKQRETNARPYFCSYGTVQHRDKQIAKFEIKFKTENNYWDIFQ